MGEQNVLIVHAMYNQQSVWSVGGIEGVKDSLGGIERVKR